MATVSLSPTPAPIASVMASRRGPLTTNTNAANSPLRAPGTALAGGTKPKRSLANALREETYGQPPPKKQALDNGSQRPRSPTKVPRPQVMVQRDGPTKASRNYTSTSRSSTVAKPVQAEAIDKETWKNHFKAKFPKMVFYFESVPDDVRARLTRRIAYLGAVGRACLLHLALHANFSPASRTLFLQRSDSRHHYSTDPERTDAAPRSPAGEPPCR